MLIRERALVLRTCGVNMTSYNGFAWPKSGLVECDDWKVSRECGNGLHGALWGVGDGRLFNWSPDAVWQVVQVDQYIDLDGKVKFPSGNVVHTGDQRSATKYLADNGGDASKIIGSIVGDRRFKKAVSLGDYGEATAGDRGKATAGRWGEATAGDCGEATAGYRGEATAGDRGKATAGYRGEAIAGNSGKAIAGDYGKAIAGKYGEAIAGDDGKAIAGNWGKATAGNWGEVIAGDYGKAIAGDYGKAIAGYGGKARAGHNGLIIIKNSLGKCITGHTSKDIKPNVFYKLDDQDNLIECS